MARRKAKRRSRRRAKINVTNIVEAGIQANFLTMGMFRAPIGEFLTGNFKNDAGSLSVSAWELISGIWGGNNYGNIGNLSPTWDSSGTRGGLPGVIKANIEAYGGGKMVAGLIMTPIAFRIGKRMLSKPRSMINTKLLKGTGLAV